MEEKSVVLVSQCFDYLLVHERLVLAAPKPISRVYVEGLGEREHLLYSWVVQRPGAHGLDLGLAHLPRRPTRNLRIRKRLASALVHYRREQVVQKILQSCPRWRSLRFVPALAPPLRLLQPELRREAHHLGYGLQLVQSRLLDPARQEVGEVGGVDEATGRLLHPRARPLPTRRMGVSLQQPREHVRVPGVSRHLPRPFPRRVRCIFLPF